MHFVEIISSCDKASRFEFNTSRIYNITVQGRSGTVPVYCELNTNGGNWLVSYFIIIYSITNTFSSTL